MKFKICLFVVVILCVGEILLFAQDKAKKENIPPWMEKIDRGGSTYLIPKGSKVDDVTSGFVKIEPPAEYVARRFYEQEDRLKKIEKNQEQIAKELIELKKEIEEIRQQRSVIQSEINGNDDL